MTQKKHAQPAIKAKKNPLKKHIRLTFLGSILAIAIVVVAVNIFGYFSKQIQAEIVRSEAIKALATSAPNLDTRHDNYIHEITSGLGESAAAYSSKVATCYLMNQQKPGNMWVTVDWREQCTLSYSDLIETTLDRDALISKLKTMTDLGFNNQGSSYYEPEKCDFLWSPPQSTVRVTFMDWSRRHNTSCILSDPQSQIFGSAVGFAPVSKAYEAYDPASVDRAKSYLVVSLDGNYFTKSLGCGKSGLFGCQSPYKSPIAGF